MSVASIKVHIVLWIISVILPRCSLHLGLLCQKDSAVPLFTELRANSLRPFFVTEPDKKIEVSGKVTLQCWVYANAAVRSSSLNRFQTSNACDSLSPILP